MKDAVIVGLGNSLMSDDGIGIHLLQLLQERGRVTDHADLVELGTGGMRLIHILEGRKLAMLLDCAAMGASPGTMRQFGPDGIKSCKSLSGFSQHEGDLVTMLEVAKQMDACPKDVVIFGIEPEAVEPGDGLSEPLLERIEEYAELIEAELLNYARVLNMPESG